MRAPCLLRLCFVWAALLLAAVLPVQAQATSPDELPPVDEVFALSARADSREAITLTWKIAPGYYLYRHRTKAASPDGSFAGESLTLPAGTPHRDEFFGDVQMYRNQLRATVNGTASGNTVQLRVEYQGCADIGICYPPTTRTINVAMPAAAAPASGTALNLAAPAGGGGLFGGALGGNAAQAAPLPDAQAFKFEAIVGDGNTILMRFTPAPGYYLYRDRSRFVLEGAQGVQAQAPRWPRGSTHMDEYFGQQVVYFQQVDVPLPLARSSTDARTVTLAATFQGCQTDGICYPPMTRKVQVALPAGTLTASTAVTPAAPMAEPLPDAPHIAQPSEVADAQAEAEQAISSGQDNNLALTPAHVDAPALSNGQATNHGLLWTLLLALGGGLILNLMPCVLPVLSLKAFSLANTAGQPQQARRHALAYTAGVLLSFTALGALALALRHAGMLMGWGFQMQQPAVVAALGLVMLGLGLGLSGLWHVGGGWTGLGDGLTRRSGALGDFFTGVLAVVVATPCIAPLMGAALAYAFTGPALHGLLVFVMLGVGLALPFLLIGFIPALARMLPKPGAWMEQVKQVLAFPMYLTAAWLLWVLAKQRGADAVGLWALAAITLGFVLWALRHMPSRAMRIAFALLGVMALAMPLMRIHGLPVASAATPAPPALNVQAGQTVTYSPEALSQLRAQGMPVFVNITADWCVTCKANERTVLSRESFSDALRQAGAAYMVGDYTDADPVITTFLQEWRAVGIPLYVVYPAGGGAGVVLPTVLTPEIAASALQQAAAP